VWGVVVEGIILYGLFNVLGWFFLFVVYGSFASIPLLLTKEKFANDRKNPTFKTYIITFGLLMLTLLTAQISILVMAAIGIR